MWQSASNDTSYPRLTARRHVVSIQHLGTDIQWLQSYVTDDRTYCVYLAKDESIIRRHAEISGFPANKITEVRKIIDLTTAANWAKHIRR
jgi:Protein of unknown function (DUF4242)